MTDDLKELKKIYYESGIWLRWNWYDFLEELVRILRKVDKKDLHKKKDAILK